jgi:cell division protein FtsB
MNYFFITTLIFLLSFLITLIFLILSLKKSALQTSKLEHDKNGLKEKVHKLETINGT